MNGIWGLLDDIPRISTIPDCAHVETFVDKEGFGHWLEGVPTLQNVARVEDIDGDLISKPTQKILKLLLSSKHCGAPCDETTKVDDDDHAEGLLRCFNWPEASAQEQPSQLAKDEGEEPDGGDLLKLLDEKDEQFLKPSVPGHNILLDFVKRSKWCVQGQVLSEALQFTIKNHKAQMIGKLMDDCSRARSYQDEIVAYLNSLNDKSIEISSFFGELLQIYHEMKPQLNELNHIKKVFQRVSRKHSVPGLSQHIERMDVFQFEQQDGGSADYLEDLIRTRSIFAESFQDLSYCKISMEKVFESCKHLGFSTSFNRTQYNIWRTFFSWKSQENELPGDDAVQEDPQSYFRGNLKEEIFQIATDLYVIGITVYLMTRSLLLRLKSLYDTALYIKKQYRVYKVCSIKLQLLENSLENCIKEWINYEKILLHFKNKDMYKSYRSPNLSSLRNLVPYEYIGWEIPLIASKADKILLRKVKKRSATHHSKSQGGHSPLSPPPRVSGASDKRRAHVRRKESDAIRFGAGAQDSDEEVTINTKRRASKVSPRTKADLETGEQQKKQKYLKNKSLFDVSLEDFAKHLEERSEKELMEEMRNPDLASTLQEQSLDASQNSGVSPENNADDDIKMRFCENPIYTNVSHLIDQDEQIKSLEKEYYEKLLSLMRAKEDFRKYKSEISNVRTQMTSLSEEYSTIKKYIVSRDEAHLITNFSLMADTIMETKIHHEIESRNLSAEVKRSLRLIKKGKYDDVEWLMSRLEAVKDQSRLSDEEQLSKKSSSASEQLKSSNHSGLRNVSSKSTTNASNFDEKSMEKLDEKQETSDDVDTKIDESLKDSEIKMQKIDKMVAMVLSLGDGKMSYNLCETHSQSVPPFCCLQEYFKTSILVQVGNDPKGNEVSLDAEPSVTKSDSDAASGLLVNEEELGQILSNFKTTKRDPDCEFPSDVDEQEFETSSHQSSFKMDATLGSWTDSELEEVVDSGTYSSQGKLNPAIETLMENKQEIIRLLTHKYIMEKCGELFIDQHTAQSSFESADGSDHLTMLKTSAERELVEHRQELMSLYDECSAGAHGISEADSKSRKQSLYEARLRSEQLMEIRVLKSRIKEKMNSVEELENELERLRLRKYPTFDH
ncbi:hypothetical protein GE061_000725 [Apolygus lucorum]|uniref:Uncharacterized protein n=1 Tax=Apolygus lucorum TaxID=248454 RepID=A0A8S9Y5D8_APOLU|nr:hypothetical protein GE061_000725 [Apolygus lucorum]